MSNSTPPSSDSGEIKLHFLDYWRVIRVRYPLIILVFLLVMVTAAVVTYFMPKQYESRVTMEIQQNNNVLPVFTTMADGRMGFDPRFLTTQFEIIQRKEVLYPVIESLDLGTRWREQGFVSTEMVYERLRRMINVQEIRNTQLIQINVLSTDNREAMEIANAIADEYQKRRVSEQTEWVSRSLEQLQDEVQKQREKVEVLRKEAERIRVEYGINDLNPESQEDPLQAQEQVLLTIEQQVSTERLRVSALRAKYEMISPMTDDQIMRSVAALEIQDPTILQVLPLFQSAASQEAGLLNSGLGPNHPTVRALRASKDEMEQQLRAQIAVLRRTLEANLRIAEDSLQRLEQQLSQSRSSQQEGKTRSAVYNAAKTNYINAKKILEAAETRLATQTMERSMPQNPAIIWERADISTMPSRPRVALNLALGAVVGLVFGVGLVFFIEYLDTSVKTLEDVESFLQVPVLSVVPKNMSVLLRDSPDTPNAEAYRILRTNIEFNRKTPDANTLTIVSGGAGEGKSTTLVNLAYTFAQGGYSTLIVDADLRRPSQHQFFETANEIGLSDYLTRDLELEEVVSQTSFDNLYLMTSGALPSDAVGVLNSQRMIELIEDVKTRFDIVFFDSPPILGVSDASVLASAVDLTLIVVQHRRFPRAMLQRVKQAVLNVGGNILGVVLNNVDVRHDQHYEYYTSYYNYYSRPSKNTRKRSGKTRTAAAPAPGGHESEY